MIKVNSRFHFSLNENEVAAEWWEQGFARFVGRGRSRTNSDMVTNRRLETKTINSSRNEVRLVVETILLFAANDKRTMRMVKTIILSDINHDETTLTHGKRSGLMICTCTNYDLHAKCGKKIN